MKNRQSAVSLDTLTVFCTCPPGAVAERLATLLVEKKLAACVNITAPVLSVYRWQEAVQSDTEVLLIIKTSAPAWPALEQVLREQHPYDVPEIIAMPVVEGSSDYLRWVEDNTCID